MKFNRKYFTISIYAILGSVFVVLFAVGLYNFSKVLSVLSFIWNACKPVVYGILIALVVNPTYSTLYDRIFSFVQRKRSHSALRKAISLIVAYAILLTVLIAFLAAVLPQVISSCEEIAAKSTSYLSAALNWLESRLNGLSVPDFLLSTSGPIDKGEFNEGDLLSIEEFCQAFPYGAHSPLQQARIRLTILLQDKFIKIDITKMLQDFLDHTVDALTEMIPTILLSFNQVLTEMKNILLGIVISIYFLVSKEKMQALIAKLMRTVFGEKTNRALHSFGHTAHLVYIEFMMGKTLDAIIVMCFSYILFMIFKFPYPILLSSIIGSLNLIPFLGPIIGTVICACIVFVFAPSKTLFFLILIFLIEQLDLHFLEPHIIGQKQYLSNFGILLSVIIMGRAFGVFGCFLGVPTFSVIGIVYQRWLDKKAKALNYESNSENGKSDKDTASPVSETASCEQDL